MLEEGWYNFWFIKQCTSTFNWLHIVNINRPCERDNTWKRDIYLPSGGGGMPSLFKSSKGIGRLLLYKERIQSNHDNITIIMKPQNTPTWLAEWGNFKFMLKIRYLLSYAYSKMPAKASGSSKMLRKTILKRWLSSPTSARQKESWTNTPY